MRKKLITLIASVALLLSLPAFASASHPGEGHPSFEPRHSIDWKAYPTDIQAYKSQLDQIRDEQRELFHRMKAQHRQLRETGNALTDEQQQKLKQKANPIVEQMKASKESIHALRERKNEAWDSFHEHAQQKQWSSAKSDLETIVKQKRAILEKQQTILKLQKQLIELMPAVSSKHIHSEE
jgi:hypothetical protein